MREFLREIHTQLRSADTTRCLAVGAAIVVGMVVASGLGYLRPLELILYAPRVLNANYFTPDPSDAIVHVDIDDNAIENLGRWPWPRDVQAAAINMLQELNARVIALDVI